RIPGVLARPDGWLGLRGDAEGPWTWSPPGSPIELVVTETPHAPWSVALRASTSAGSVLGAPLVRFGVDTESALPSFTITGGVELGVGALTLRFDTSARTLDVAA